jgi:sugar/nucleoside kinase (ribokinase family)
MSALPVRGRRRPLLRAVVLGDLVVDVVLTPERPLEHSTDVPGRVTFRQGGSAATTARWLARLGARTTLICAVGRDGAGRALVQRVASDGVRVAAVRVAGARTGRIGVLVEPGGERSFVTDRGAAERLRPEDLRDPWFAGADVLHLPAYSLLARPLADAAMAAIRRARAADARISLDLSSVAPLLAGGRRAARALLEDVAPDVIFATAVEAGAIAGARLEVLVELAPIVIVKRGARGATVLAREDDRMLRFEVATRPMPAADTTGAGDAFDAGFLVGWLEAERRGTHRPAALQRGALAGHRAAARQLAATPQELPPG